jgi:hypothetical protein
MMMLIGILAENTSSTNYLLWCSADPSRVKLSV